MANMGACSSESLKILEEEREDRTHSLQKCRFLEVPVKGFLLLNNRLSVAILRLRLKEKTPITVIK